MEETKMSLGDVLNAMNDGTIADGDIIRNLGTDERVIIDNGDIKYLTFNDYISNAVPLVDGMINAWWIMEERAHVVIAPDKAVEVLSHGKSIEISSGSDLYLVNTSSELFTILEQIGLKDVEYKVLRSDINEINSLKKMEEDEQKSRGRTSESEAWAMLMDRYLFDFPVKDIAGKFGTSLRNAYYILDGTYYPEVYKRFNQLVETGELYVGDK